MLCLPPLNLSLLGNWAASKKRIAEIGEGFIRKGNLRSHE